MRPFPEFLAPLAATYRATPAERGRPLPGDELVVDPIASFDHAITIAAPPDRVWPWLAQMGSGRAGWYAYDRIDNGGRASARAIDPALQAVHPGDVMPAIPGADDAFVVASVDPPRSLVLIVPGTDGAPITSWAHVLVPLAADRSRLLARGRIARGWKTMARGAGADRPILIERIYALLGRLPDPLMLALAGAGHYVMEARHLDGIRRRAETGPS